MSAHTARHKLLLFFVAKTHNKALHSDSQKLRHSYLAMQLLAAGELGR